jgi:hypothetical protein
MPMNKPGTPLVTWNEAMSSIICFYKLHNHVVITKKVTKDLCFSLSVRGRREGREAHIFEDKKGDGALRST